MTNAIGRAKCAACRHPKRKEIDTAIKAGASMTGLVTTYGISRTALYRHRAHMDDRDPDKTKSFEEKSSVEKANEMEKISRSLLSRAASSGDVRGATALVRACNESLALSSKLRGEMSGRPPEDTGGYTWSDFNRFTDSLLTALDEKPEAKKAVLDALSGMGGENAEDLTGSPVDTNVGAE